ncbi:MAG: hypothetical protein QM753_06820 [Thermomicrobiales bacterium]
MMTLRQTLAAMLTSYQTTELVPDLREARSPAGDDASSAAAPRKARQSGSTGRRTKARATVTSSKQLSPETKDPSPEQ